MRRKQTNRRAYLGFQPRLLEKDLKVLCAMNKWRRGRIHKMPYSPETFGIAIDNMIRLLRMLRKSI